MAVYSDFYNYVGGVYTYTSGSLVGYHAIIIVGYDDLGQYFIVKNSWGTGWGEQGYFRIAYSELTGVSEFGFETIAYPAPQNNYTLAVSKTGTGTGAVNSWPAGINCGTTCSANYASGTQVTLTATPDTNMTFAGWSGACSGAGTCTVTMDGAKSVTAIFNLAGYTLSVSKAGTGTGTVTSTPAGITCGITCSANYANGTQVTLMATPDANVTFAGWSGACSGAGTCTVTMDGAKSVTATFTGPDYMGCYTDSSARALPTELSSGGETVESCKAKAATAGYAYAGVQYYGQCWGGNTLGYQKVADAECNTPCNANPAETCGGVWLNSIYQTAVHPSNYTLSVSKAGTGTGTVTSTPAGITCGITCSANYANGTQVPSRPPLTPM